MLISSLLLLGLVVGPVLGIAVDRTVDRLHPVAEHRCVQCEAGLGPRSLVPVLSWRQHCGNCARHKGLRYPLVDLSTAAIFALLGSRFGDDWRLTPYLAMAAVLVVLSAIDIETHLLPNILVWPSIGVGLFVVLVVSGERNYADGLRSALLGAALFGGFIGLAHLFHERGMGRGDVKLSLLLGLFVGWVQPDALQAVRLVLYAILIALLGGGLLGLAYNAIRRRGRAEIPFGPALAVGALTVILVSPALVGG